jgi:hypothetical protein
MRAGQTVIMIAGTPAMHWAMIPAAAMAMQSIAFFMDLLPVMAGILGEID